MGLFDSWKKKKISGVKKNAPKLVESEAVSPVVEKKKKALPMSSLAHQVLLFPHVSEKTTVQEAFQKYTFIVADHATKHAVRQAVKDVYGVTPCTVRMMRVQGKNVRVGRFSGKRSDIKKAIVTVPKGQSLRIHESV